MRRSGRLVLIAAAWVGPLVWLALWPLAGASDGTSVSAPGAVLGDGRWEESLLVLETYGGTPLRPGDEIIAIERTPVADLTGQTGLAEGERGDVLRYLVLRPSGGLVIRQEVEVPLTRYPLGAALLESPQRLVVSLGLLLAGTILVLRGARPVLAAATLGAGTAAAVALTSHPLGVQAVDVAGAGAFWPHVVGEVGIGVALGALLVAIWSFPRPPALLTEHRAWALLVVPFGAWAVWLGVYAVQQPALARLQAGLDLTLPAVLVAAVLAVIALATGRVRATSVDELVALRLLLSALLTATIVILVLDLVPLVLRGDALVGREVLALLLVPTVLSCWVAAVLHFRVREIDAALRRSLLQVVLASVVGAVFLAAANAVNLAAGTSIRSMVTGAIVALVLLPVALLLRRTASRLVYGDRAFPYRVVSELRRLEPTTAPEDVFDEMLAMLSRSLGLSYARIESTGLSPEGRFSVELGVRRGDPTTVDLEVAGNPAGRLEMEVSPMREPFGPRDRRLLEDVGTQVGALVQALAGSRELQRSRERLVAAREEERRRLRRDLHDGLGPSLAATLMRLEVVRDRVTADPESRQLVGELVDQTEADIGEVRRLVEGLRPPALDQLGLVSALRQRADQHNHAVQLGSESPRWAVVADDVGALPAAVEVAAYRIAVEAVNNAVRHSGGSAVTVTLRRVPGALELVIRDDGTGPSVAGDSGAGISSMRDRAEELGGTCTVSAAPGGGTQVVATLPAADPSRHDRDGER